MQELIDAEQRRRAALENLLRSASYANHIASIATPVHDIKPKSKCVSPSQKPLCVRVSVATQMIGIGKTKMYELIKSGEIETLKIGKSTLVVVASLEALIQERSKRGP